MNSSYLSVRAAMLFASIALALPAQAATLNFVAAPSSEPGTIRVDALLDPQGVSLNAVSGALAFPANLLSVTTVDTHDSPINAWIVAPHVVSSGLVRWSGIIPGGYTGTRSALYAGQQAGRLFELTFAVRELGTATLTPQEILLLLNDGQGTPTAAISVPLTLSLTALAPASTFFGNGPANPAPLPADPAWVHIDHSPLVADGKWYATFDPDTHVASIDHEEVAETFGADSNPGVLLVWARVPNPYVLGDQGRNQYLHIKFVGSNGQDYLITIPPSPDSSHSRIPLAGIIICVLGAVLLLAFGFLKNRSKHL